MESADKVPNQHFAVSLLGLPAEDDVFAEDEDANEIWIKPKSSPLPRRRSSSSDEGPEPPPTPNRKVSFADAFGLELVSVREFDKWDLPTGTLGGELPGDRLPLEECLLLPLFELPFSPDDLMQKLYTQKVELESTEFPPGTTCMKGLIRVLNISYAKLVYIRMTLNHWESYYDILADYVADSCDGATDQFIFKISLVPPYLKDGAKIEFAIRYETPGAVYWANNDHKNYVVLCHKKGDPNANGKSPEELDDRNLKSCLKTSYSKENLETPDDDGYTVGQSTKDTAQQENRETPLEMNKLMHLNTESIFDDNPEQKEERSKQLLDTQINSPFHISLTSPRGQETDLTLVEGSHTHVLEEQEQNASKASESPVNQQNDLEVEHKFASVSNFIANEEKQEKELTWVRIQLDSNKNTSSWPAQSHEECSTLQTESVNFAVSNDNRMTKSSMLFYDEADLLHESCLPVCQVRDELVTSHGSDTSAKSGPELNSFSGNRDSVFANNMQDKVIIQGAIDKCDKLLNNTQNPIQFQRESMGAENGSGEYDYLTDNTVAISESESTSVSAVCTNTDLESESGRKSSTPHGSILSKEKMVCRVKANDTQEPPRYYSKVEKLDDVQHGNDFSTKSNLTNQEAENRQEQISIKHGFKVSDLLEVTKHSKIGKEMVIKYEVAANEESSCDVCSNNKTIDKNTVGVMESMQHTDTHSDSDHRKYQNTGKEFGACLQSIPSKQLEFAPVLNIETATIPPEIPKQQGSLEEEKYQDPCEVDDILTQFREIDSTKEDIVNEQNKNKIPASQIAELSTSAPSCMLADTVVKEAIEAALFEISGDEGRGTTLVSQKEEATQNVPSEDQFSMSTQEGSTSFLEQPSKIHSAHEQIAKDVSQLGEHITETNTVCVQMGKDAGDASQKNSQVAASTINLLTKTSAPISEDTKSPDASFNYSQSLEATHKLTADFQVESQSEPKIAEVGQDVADSVKEFPNFQEEAGGRISRKITETSEKIPENIFESSDLKISDNYEVKQTHTEVVKELASNTTELPEEKVHYHEREKNTDFIQHCHISELGFKQNSSAPDLKGSTEVGKTEHKGEEALSINTILQHYGGTNEPRSMGFPQSHKFTMSKAVKEVVPVPGQIVVEGADDETNIENEAVDKQKCGAANEVIMDIERERADIDSESVGAHYLKNVEMCHDTQLMQVNESKNQNAVRPKNIAKFGSSPYISSDTTEKKNGTEMPPQNPEPSSHHKYIGPVILISKPIEGDEEKITNSDISSNVHPCSERLEFEECNEKIFEYEHASEAYDGDVKSEELRLQSEPFADEVNLKNTVWKVCYFVLFIVFLVTVYHYDFIGCFALYIFSLYWLYCEGETNDSVKKE
ncbi:protein phosphatase 1 regulatory subunit 3A [Chiloscyllium plagiosum]|uniref:protein phosphatase 1 regulatory subunit 3A n=1 Tax=Chiloscyllium plagiosum TaxID=36176 RepID=UPI001CB7B19A|nr:protein phosphatase 1 regulatory subunit 3A [Chiloscyllium plagiosum]